MVLINLNNKLFEAKFSETGRVNVPLSNDSDKLFFRRWQDKAKSSNKKTDYVQDLEFITSTRSGQLCHCFPILDINEEFVTLHFDCFLYLKNE